MNEFVQNALKFINQRPEIRQFIANFNNDDSFMFSKSPYIAEISEALKSDCHSGASFGCMLQECRRRILDDIECGKKLSNIVNTDNMDDDNKTAMKVAETQGLEACIEHMFTEKDTGRKMTYGEMRMRYG